MFSVTWLGEGGKGVRDSMVSLSGPRQGGAITPARASPPSTQLPERHECLGICLAGCLPGSRALSL